MSCEDPFNASIFERFDLTAALAILRVRPDSGCVPPFQPGQFATLGLPAPPPRADSPAALRRRNRLRLTRRAYSIASCSRQRDYFEFYAARIEGGVLTPQLWQLPVGGRLFMDERVRGEFTLDALPNDQNLVMIATGTGVAPFISMIRTFTGHGRWRRCVLIHGVRRAADLGYHRELLDIQKRTRSFRYLPTVTREPVESHWRGLRGRVQALVDSESFSSLAGLPLDANGTHALLCGNPEMIVEVTQLLQSKGFTLSQEGRPGNLHVERYW